MINQEVIKEMYKAGVHFGRKKSNTDPKMKPFIYGEKNGFQVISLEKTAEKLIAAGNFLAKIIKDGGKIIFVGTKPEAKKITEETAKRCGQLYVSGRWLGGTITNFSTISKRINHMKDLERKTESGELKKYTKKEQLNFEKELVELTKEFGGVRDLDKLPQAIFVFDVKHDAIAVKEAKKKKIPVIGLANTNADPNFVEYPIPANNNSVSSLKYLADKISEIVLANKL